MRVIEKEIFKYEELDDRAKDKVKDRYRQFVFNEPCDWEFVYEDAERAADILGIDIEDFFLDNSHDGYSSFSPTGSPG
jgi:hypothetical protein